MGKIKISIAIMLLLIGVGAVNLHANPLPSCSDEWCHFTHPNWVYHVFRDGFVSSTDGSFAPEFHEWMSKNCPNWPELNALFKPLYLPRTIHRDYENEVNALWEKNHPKDKGIIRSGEEKIREEQYLAAQKEEYGRNIPYCLTEKAQNRVQQERRETEKYLQDAQNVPMVRDRLAMLAKIEEANAKTAKELRLENLYKATPEWKIDKATLNAWWAETHPNGQPLDKQAIKQRYKDYFAKQEWKQAHSNELESSIEEIRTWKEQQKIQIEQKRQKDRKEYEDKIENFWRDNFPNWPKVDFSAKQGTYQNYQEDVDDLWLKYHKEPTYTDCIGICRERHDFSAPFEERESFFLNKQKEKYGQNIPYCLTETMQKSLREHKKLTEEYLRGDTANRSYFEEDLKRIIASEQANAQLAAELGLDSLIKNEPQDRTLPIFVAPLLLTGIIAVSIVAVAAILLFRRKKNLPK